MADIISSSAPARPPVSFGVWLGVVLLFLFFGIFVLVLVAATPHGNTYEEKRAKAREEKLKTIRDTAAKDLNSYAWVDKGKGIARIPIDRAMQLTLRDLAAKKPEPANPITTPAAAAAPAASPPAPAVSPAAASPGASGTPKPTSVQGINSENRGQPAAASNPPGAIPGTQPGPGATPAASPPPPPSAQPSVTSSATPEQKPPGTPVPAPAKSPP